MVGREAELAKLDAFLDAPGSLVIAGAPGIGKTTLWEAGVGAALARGLRVLVARPGDAEADLAFAALTDLLEDVDAEALDALPAPQRRGLEVALLRAEPSPVPAEPRAIVLGFFNALRALSSSAPVLVAIDDIQWLDRSSADALAFAARRLPPDDVRFLVTQRADEASALDEALAGAQRLEVEPLSLGAIRRVLFEQLGVAVNRRVLRQIADAAAGNPLFAIELGRALETRGPPQIGEPVAAPDALEDLVGARVASLRDGPRRVLLAVALSTDLRLPQLAAVADQHAIDEALDAGLLAIDRDRVRASHPLLGAAARANAGTRERRELHLALADAVDREHRPVHLALAAAAPDAGLAATVAEAAARAAARTHAEEAAMLAEHALRLTPPADPARTDRLLTLTRYLLVAGEDARASELLGPEADALPTSAARARAYLLLADSGVVATVDQYERHLARAYEESADHPGLRAEAAAAQAHAATLARVERIAEAERAAVEALPVARATGPALEREVIGAIAWARCLRGLPVDDLLERYRAASDDPVYIYRSPERPAAVRLAWRGEVRAARERLADLLVRADERGEGFAYVAVRLNLLEAHLRAGGCDEAERLLQEWGESSTELVIGPIYERCRAVLAATRGRPDEAAEWAERALAGFAESGMVWDRLESLRARGLAAVLAGDHGLAVESLGEVWAHTERAGVDEPGAFPVAPDLVEALIGSGEPDEAGAVTARLAALAERLDHPWGRVTAVRSQAVLDLSGGAYDDGAGTALERAAAGYAELGLGFDAARTWLALGSAQRRFRKWGAARASLERAAGEFDGLGAGGWAERARAELARVGARRPAATGELTPTERRVAELAAQGNSNKAIAAQLVVTVHTIEVHLSKAYAKLGVRSRNQLAGRLGEPKD